MSRLDEKIYDDKKRVNDYERKEASDFGEQKVTDVGHDSEGHQVIRLSNNADTVIRKEHIAPEHVRTQGG